MPLGRAGRIGMGYMVVASLWLLLAAGCSHSIQVDSAQYVKVNGPGCYATSFRLAGKGKRLAGLAQLAHVWHVGRSTLWL